MDITAVKPRRVATLEQVNTLIECMLQQPKLARKQLGRSTEGIMIAKRLWKEITLKLNAVGPTRSSKEWCKYWYDYKSRLRRKALDVNLAKEQNKMSDVMDLSDKEESIIQLIGLPVHNVVRSDPLAEEQLDSEDDGYNVSTEDIMPTDQTYRTRSSVQEVLDTQSSSESTRKRRHSSIEALEVEDDDRPPDTKIGIVDAENSVADNEAAAFLRLEREKLESTNRLTEAVQDVRAEVSRLADVLTEIKDVLIEKLNV